MQEIFKDSDFKKSAKSTAQGGCVGVARKPTVVGVRNESVLSQGVLKFDPDAFDAFLEDCRNGKYDLA